MKIGILFFIACGSLSGPLSVSAQESIWIEAEHLEGIQGYCWPMGSPEMRKTNGYWGISGPGWTAEWTQGGESSFMSIACGPDDDGAAAGTTIEIPEAGQYHVWVRYRDTRESSNRFQIHIEQPEGKPWLGTYGQNPIIEEDNEMKLYWGWAFAWDQRDAELQKGQARLSLRSAFKEEDCRQIDCMAITTDASYHPFMKERPRNPNWQLLETYRKGIPEGLEPLARRRNDFAIPKTWEPKTFKDKGFIYLWNTTAQHILKWAGSDPNRVLYPNYMLQNVEAFEKKYGGKEDVPILSDPRIVPAVHGHITSVDQPEARQALENFTNWLQSHPDRFWATLMPGINSPLPGVIRQNLFAKFKDRYVGNVHGEAIAEVYPSNEQLKEVLKAAKTRREVAEALTKVFLDLEIARYRNVFGNDSPQNFSEAISCPSADAINFYPLCYLWGARTVGYESATATSAVIGMRWAFLRGAARQHGGMTATYRSSNFGDSATIFADGLSMTRNVLDNYYDVFSGAGMTWYKMDIWYQYMAGSSMFYHEQGHDEFWMPGGTSAAGQKEIQLSPKGKLVDRFMRLTAREPNRGTPFTPVALLVDYAHGWDPIMYYPRSFGIRAHDIRPDVTSYSDHEKMLQEYFWTAYHPIGPKSEEAITGTNEVYVAGVFGDIFDVIYAYPDIQRWRTISNYPVVIAAGEIELTLAEGDRLAKYITEGGTLLVADAQLSGPGLPELEPPPMGDQEETAGYRWLEDGTVHNSQRFRFRPITGGRALAKTADGKVFCSSFERGKGRLVFLSVPRGLGIDRAAIPVVARLFAHLTRELMPLEVAGDVEWMVNRSQDGWLVTLLNPAGQAKPQHGLTPTDFRENRTITIKAKVPIKSAHDRLAPADRLQVRDDAVYLVVPAGGVRIIQVENRNDR